MSSCLGLRRFIVCMISTISARPWCVLCRPSAINSTTGSELLEIVLLGGTKRILPEERNDPVEQILSSMNGVAVQMLPMVVMPPVDIHLSHSEELTQLLETADARRALCHNEVVRDLVSGRVATPTRARWLPHEPDREASFSVYKTDHPSTELDQPFLLVFRTRHVVTVDIQSDVISSAGYSGFPAYGQMRTASLPMRGATNSPETLHCLFQACHLRTVIVTAAVYRGLDSKLRPKTNLSS